MRTLPLLILALALGTGCTSCAPPEASPSVPVEVEPAAPPEPTYYIDQKFFNLLITRLKEECPLNDEVLVFLQKSDSYWGATWWTEEDEYNQQGYKIQLNPQQEFHSLVDTLVHEWAHAMVWDAQPDGSEMHDAIWGVAWARAYRTLVGAWGEHSAASVAEQCSLGQ